MTDRVPLGIALMIGFCVIAPMLDAFAKLAAETIPVGQITTARFIVQAAIMAPVCMIMGFGLRLDPRLLGQMTLRALCLIGSTYCFVAAVSRMPIADALAIAFVEPFILLILGKFLFGDEVGPRRIAASVVGFGGSLLVIQPSFSAFGYWALFPLGTAVLFALYMLVTRGLSRKIHPLPMQFHTATVATAICVPITWIADITAIPTLDPVMPEGIFWVWLFGVGACSAASHGLMTYALRFAPSATLAPLHYLEIVSAAILGFLIFQDFPNLLTWTGIAIIVSSGLYIVHRERMTARSASVTLPPSGQNRA